MFRTRSDGNLGSPESYRQHFRREDHYDTGRSVSPGQGGRPSSTSKFESDYRAHSQRSQDSNQDAVRGRPCRKSYQSKEHEGGRTGASNHRSPKAAYLRSSRSRSRLAAQVDNISPSDRFVPPESARKTETDDSIATDSNHKSRPNYNIARQPLRKANTELDKTYGRPIALGYRAAFGCQGVNVSTEGNSQRIHTNALLDTGARGKDANLVSLPFLREFGEVQLRREERVFHGLGSPTVKTCGKIHLKIFPLKYDSKTKTLREHAPLRITFYIYDEEKDVFFGDLLLGRDYCREHEPDFNASFSLPPKLSPGMLINFTIKLMYKDFIDTETDERRAAEAELARRDRDRNERLGNNRRGGPASRLPTGRYLQSSQGE